MMLAKKVMTADDEVDRLFDKIRQEIIDYIAKDRAAKAAKQRWISSW